jgi:hypothetical protein
MAHLNVFVVSFILLRPRRNGSKRAHRKEHFSRLPYSAAPLEPRDPLLALSLLKLAAKLLRRRFLLAARLADRAPRWSGAGGILLHQSRLRFASSGTRCGSRCGQIAAFGRRSLRWRRTLRSERVVTMSQRTKLQRGRMNPAKYARLAEGDAHVIRNTDGRATDDAIPSLVISHKLLDTREWFVIHHTNCGMEVFSDDVIADLLDDDLATASFDGKSWSNPHHRGGHAAGHFIKWNTIKDQEVECGPGRASRSGASAGSL